MTRDVTLDTLRGLAIFLMVQANIAGSIFAHPYPKWMNIYVALGSFVPALFVMVAGMMVVYTAVHKNYEFKHYLFRSGMLFVTAALVIDVFIWELVPFINFEILYLIALSLPLTFLFYRLTSRARWAIIASIFLLTPVLQTVFGYTPQPLVMSIFKGVFFAGIPGQTGIINHWFIDGWFPIFPWIGFAFLGAELGIMRFTKKVQTFATRKTVLFGTLLFFIGTALWTLYSGGLYAREGFSETIYPPTLAYSITSVGQILLLFALIDWRPALSLYKPLRALGESSLFVYIAHFMLIDFFPSFPTLLTLLLLAGGSLIFLFTLSYALRSLRTRFPKRPLWLRYIFGI